MPCKTLDASELRALANATTAARHNRLVASMQQQMMDGTPNDLMVLNTIDQHYTHLIAAWKAMIMRARFPKYAFVVAMDSAAADATRAAGLAYFAPTAENEVEPTPCTNNNRAGGASINTPKPGTYHKTLIQGKEADTRILPPDLPSWKMHAVWAALSLEYRVLFSESDVLWMPGDGLATHILATTEDFAPQRHPMTPVWNFGFFYAHGKRSSNFFGCGIRHWERRHLAARHAGKAVDIGSDQRFLWDAWRTKMCGPLEVKKLPLALYPTCRDWLGPSRSNALAVHVTYCHKLSMLLSSEDVCKRRLTEMFYLGGGIAVGNLTSKAWNKEQGC